MSICRWYAIPGARPPATSVNKEYLFCNKSLSISVGCSYVNSKQLEVNIRRKNIIKVKLIQNVKHFRYFISKNK